MPVYQFPLQKDLFGNLPKEQSHGLARKKEGCGPLPSQVPLWLMSSWVWTYISSVVVMQDRYNSPELDGAKG